MNGAPDPCRTKIAFRPRSRATRAAMFGRRLRLPFTTTASARPISRQRARQPPTGTGHPPGGRKRVGKVTSAAAVPSRGLQARTRTAQPRSARSVEAVSTNCSTPPACGSTKLETINARLACGAGATSRCLVGAGTAFAGAGTGVAAARAIARSAPPVQQRPPCCFACARTRQRGRRGTRALGRARAAGAVWHRRLISPADRESAHHVH